MPVHGLPASRTPRLKAPRVELPGDPVLTPALIGQFKYLPHKRTTLFDDHVGLRLIFPSHPRREPPRIRFVERLVSSEVAPLLSILRRYARPFESALLVRASEFQHHHDEEHRLFLKRVHAILAAVIGEINYDNPSANNALNCVNRPPRILAADAVQTLHEQPRALWYSAKVHGSQKGPKLACLSIGSVICRDALVGKIKLSIEWYALSFGPLPRHPCLPFDAVALRLFWRTEPDIGVGLRHFRRRGIAHDRQASPAVCWRSVRGSSTSPMSMPRATAIASNRYSRRTPASPKRSATRAIAQASRKLVVSVQRAVECFTLTMFAPR